MDTDLDAARDTAPARTHHPLTARRCLELQEQLADLFRQRWTRREAARQGRAR